MAGVIDFGIRISQQIVGDDALGKLQKLETQLGRESTAIAGMENKLDSARQRLAALMDGGASGKSASIAAVDNVRAAIAKLEGDLGKKRSGLGELIGGLGGAQEGALAQAAMEKQAKVAEAMIAREAVLQKNKARIALEDAQAKKTAAREASEVEAAMAAQSEAASANLARFGDVAMTVTKVAVGLGLAVAATVIAFSGFALTAADAHRSDLLMMGALAGSAEAGSANVEAIERVADSTALAKGQIEAIGKRLAVAGLDGERFEATLGAISTATALLGESAGAHLEGIIEKSKAMGHFQFSDRQLKGLGLSFGDLAAQVGMTEAAFKGAMKAGTISVEQGVDAMNAAIAKRFGGGSAAMLLGFDVQMMKLKEHVTALFKDVNIEPFLVALHDLLSVFDQSTDSGKALHLIVTAGFSAMFDALAKVEPYAKAFFQGMVIGALLLYIGFVKVKQVMDDAFGGAGLEGIDGIEIAMYTGIAVLGFFVGAFVAAAALLAIVLYPVFAILAETVVEISAVSEAWDSFMDAVHDLNLPDLGEAGDNMIAGLVNAVFNGGSKFEAAMRALGAQGMAGLDSIFHFGSPAKAMIQRGEWIDEGGAEGVENQGAMRRAMSGMASPADAKGGDVRGGDRMAHVQITIGGASEKERKSLISEMTDALEAAGVTVGWGPEPAHS